MNDLIATPAFQLWTATAAVLGMNLLVLAAATAAKRSGAQQTLNAEDLKLNAEAQVIAHDEGTAARWGRAHRNALENVPLFLITALAFTLVQPSLVWAAALFGVFTLARLSHSFCYINEVQPGRTASYGLGYLTQVVLLGALLFHTFA